MEQPNHKILQIWLKICKLRPAAVRNLFSSDIEISARLNFRRPPSTVDVVDDALIAPREWTVEGRML